MRRLVIIALLLSSEPTLAYEDIYEALKTTDTPNQDTGYGVVNADEALLKKKLIKSKELLNQLSKRAKRHKKKAIVAKELAVTKNRS